MAACGGAVKETRAPAAEPASSMTVRKYMMGKSVGALIYSCCENIGWATGLDCDDCPRLRDDESEFQRHIE